MTSSQAQPNDPGARRPDCPLSYVCSQKWSDLAPTADPNVRHCAACNTPVTFCADAATLAKVGRSGGCAALPVLDRKYRITLGLVHPREAGQSPRLRTSDSPKES